MFDKTKAENDQTVVPQPAAHQDQRDQPVGGVVPPVEVAGLLELGHDVVGERPRQLSGLPGVVLGIEHRAAGEGAIPEADLAERLLLAIYGYGTNTGIRAVAAGQHAHSEDDIRYVRRRYLTAEAAQAIAIQIANATFAVRAAGRWGAGSTAVASDSTHFGAFDQNIFTEWHTLTGSSSRIRGSAVGLAGGGRTVLPVTSNGSAPKASETKKERWWSRWWARWPVVAILAGGVIYLLAWYVPVTLVGRTKDDSVKSAYISADAALLGVVATAAVAIFAFWYARLTTKDQGEQLDKQLAA
jgi:hypothetical protein